MSAQIGTVAEPDYQRLLDFRDGLRRFHRWSAEQARSVGLTPTQHQLLLAIRGHRGRPSVGDVAAHLLVRHHSAVGLIDRAVSAGLVERVIDGEDHRVVRLALTPEGDARVEALSTAHLEELARLRTRFADLWADLPAD